MNITLIIFGIISVISFFFDLFIVTLVPPCFMPTSYHIYRMEKILQTGEMDQEEEIKNSIAHLQECKSDKRKLAERLLSDNNGTIAALGMEVVVRESFEDGDMLLKQHYGDMRWNYYLANNDEYAKFLFILWKMKKGMVLNKGEKEIMKGWSEFYFENVGIASL